jgi:hypothetical protein
MTRWLLQSLVVAFLSLGWIDAHAQTTAFTYQGRLTENGAAANGSYQMQFKLFDGLSGGTQVGATIDNVPISVNQGIFTTLLDFGAGPLTGANRWLEIAVRHNAGESYTLLATREQISSAPYAVRTVSAALADDAQKLGGIDATQYVTTGNAIRNSTLQQSPANFNISGNGLFGGKVGIGAPIPSTRLEVADPVRQMRFGPSASDDGGYLISTNPSQAIVSAGGEWNGSAWIARDAKTSLAAMQSGEIGFFADGSLDVGMPFVPTERMKIDAAGNVRQGRSTGGLAKAMAYVNAAATIVRCYNGITGVSSGNCGFSASQLITGSYIVDFGFVISDRFFAVSTEFPAAGTARPHPLYSILSSTQLVVYNLTDAGTGISNAFMVIVY